MSVELQHKKQEICELKSQQKSSLVTHQGLRTTFEQEIRDLKSQIGSNLIGQGQNPYSNFFEAQQSKSML